MMSAKFYDAQNKVALCQILPVLINNKILINIEIMHVYLFCGAAQIMRQDCECLF